MTSSELRLRELEAMMRQLHRLREPRAILADFLAGLRRIHGPFTYVELVLDADPDGDGACPDGDGACPDGDGSCPDGDGACPNWDGAAAASSCRYTVTRLLRHDGTECVPDASPFRTDRRSPRRAGGFLGRLSARPPEVHRCPVDVAADDPFADALAGHAVAVAVPVLSPGQPEWVVLLGTSPDFFADLDAAGVLVKTNLLFAALQAAHTAAELRATQDELRRHIDRIADIQRSLLPPAGSPCPGLDVAYLVEPSDVAGGDLVDLGDLDGRLVGMLVADASGHGPGAAVVAAMLATIVRAYPRPLGDPSAGELQRLRDVAELLQFANDHLCEKQIDQNFVTAWVAAFDPASRTLHYASAGHPLPLLRRGAVVRTLPGTAGVPLGIFPGQAHRSSAVVLESGDLVLAYTDGISEAAAPDGELFGPDRIAAVLGECATPADALDAVRAAVFRFTRGRRPADDQTLLAFQVT
ncbi:MAG: PP2C family protein-serine/threonine phosphatase [Tepidisphaerales bacterium]